MYSEKKALIKDAAKRLTGYKKRDYIVPDRETILSLQYKYLW
jgi:hypothetical protein